jgi:hypothetical protein
MTDLMTDLPDGQFSVVVCAANKGALDAAPADDHLITHERPWEGRDHSPHSGITRRCVAHKQQPRATFKAS